MFINSSVQRVLITLLHKHWWGDGRVYSAQYIVQIYYFHGIILVFSHPMRFLVYWDSFFKNQNICGGKLYGHLTYGQLTGAHFIKYSIKIRKKLAFFWHKKLFFTVVLHYRPVSVVDVRSFPFFSWIRTFFFADFTNTTFYIATKMYGCGKSTIPNSTEHTI